MIRNKIFYALILVLLWLFTESTFSQVAMNIEMQKAFGGSDRDFVYSVIYTSDNKIVVSGNTLSNDGDVIRQHSHSDFWIFQLDTNLNLEWSKCFGGSGSDGSHSVKKCPDGGFILIGDCAHRHGNYLFE